jgi:hypothetical protein
LPDEEGLPPLESDPPDEGFNEELEHLRANVEGGLMASINTTVSINIETIATLANCPYNPTYLIAPRHEEDARPVTPEMFLKIMVEAYAIVYKLIPPDSWLPHHVLIILLGGHRDENSSTALTARDIATIARYGGMLAWDPRLKQGINRSIVVAVATGLYTIPVKPEMVGLLRNVGTISRILNVIPKPARTKNRRVLDLGNLNRYNENCEVFNYVSHEVYVVQAKANIWYEPT